MSLRYLSTFSCAIFVSLISVFGNQEAKSAPLDCESFEDGSALCLSLPPETPELTLAGKASIPTRDVLEESFLTRAELEGEALDLVNEFLLENALDSISVAELESENAEPAAGDVARHVFEQFRFIEQYLKSGPASEGDLTVISAGRKDGQENP